MNTECKPGGMDFQGCGRRAVVADFDGGLLTSDGGLVLLRELEERRGIIKRFAACFEDWRHPALVEHSVERLVAQRTLAIVAGYEDLNDHDTLRRDPALALASGSTDLLGRGRRRERDKGAPLAGKSTLNRLELAQEGEDPEDRYKRIFVDSKKVDRLLVDLFLESLEEVPRSLVLDVDATNDPVHGEQEGRYFHGHYDEYCYLPQYIFCGDRLLSAALNTADEHPGRSGAEDILRVVRALRVALPDTKLLVRGDGAFSLDDLIYELEQIEGVHYLFGMPTNARLARLAEPAATLAAGLFAEGSGVGRAYQQFDYQTKSTWSRPRRVVARAQASDLAPDLRFVVTSLPAGSVGAAEAYRLYCGRGEMENRIKEQKLGMRSDRTSTRSIAANQLRLYFSSVAYALACEFRERCLRGTELERAQCWTLRTKLFKVAARVSVSARRVKLSLPTAFPLKATFLRAWRNAVAIPIRV